MSVWIDTVLLLADTSPPAVGQQSLLQHWLDPTVPWEIVVCAVVGLSFLSAAMSMHAWSGTRRRREIRSIDR